MKNLKTAITRLPKQCLSLAIKRTTRLLSNLTTLSMKSVVKLTSRRFSCAPKNSRREKSSKSRAWKTLRPKSRNWKKKRGTLRVWKTTILERVETFRLIPTWKSQESCSYRTGSRQSFQSLSQCSFRLSKHSKLWRSTQRNSITQRKWSMNLSSWENSCWLTSFTISSSPRNRTTWASWLTRKRNWTLSKWFTIWVLRPKDARGIKKRNGLTSNSVKPKWSTPSSSLSLLSSRDPMWGTRPTIRTSRMPRLIKVTRQMVKIKAKPALKLKSKSCLKLMPNKRLQQITRQPRSSRVVNLKRRRLQMISKLRVVINVLCVALPNNPTSVALWRLKMAMAKRMVSW